MLSQVWLTFTKHLSVKRISDFFTMKDHIATEVNDKIAKTFKNHILHNSNHWANFYQIRKQRNLVLMKLKYVRIKDHFFIDTKNDLFISMVWYNHRFAKVIIDWKYISGEWCDLWVFLLACKGGYYGQNCSHTY